MKAALKGVPSLSVRDGCWVEGHFEGVTGWSIGYDEDPEEHAVELASLYEKLEHVVLPMFYSNPQLYARIIRSSIAVHGSFFNTQRMVSQYLLNRLRSRIQRVSTKRSDRRRRGKRLAETQRLSFREGPKQSRRDSSSSGDESGGFRFRDQARAILESARRSHLDIPV